MNRGRSRNAGGYSSSRGRYSRPGGNFAQRYRPVGPNGSSVDVPLDRKDGLSHIGRQTSGKMSIGSNSKKFDCTSTSDYPYQQDCPLPGVKDISSDIGNLKLVQNSPEVVGLSSKQLECVPDSGSEFEKDIPSFSAQSDPKNKHWNERRTQRRQTLDGVAESHSSDAVAESRSSLHTDCSSIVDTDRTQDESSLLAESGIKDMPSMKGIQCTQISHEKTGGNGRSENSDSVPVGVLFDICPEKTGTLVRLKAPLHVKNREKRNEINRSMVGQNISTLRSGMVLLKSYISCRDQVKIVRTCRELGLGSGGFYQPGYRDGARLHLKMMCLGKNWDPETSKYDDQRLIDGAKPPMIPGEFYQLVKGAIKDSHAHLQKEVKAKNVENILPSMSPNLCIVNFYTNSGRLGLHQDKDESAESLRRRLPVVSFSIGDAAEFLYGDQRDTDKADKVILESGDVLVFGGESRDIFHGVSAIRPDTAPKALLEESNLRPGRLNLTFREY